MLLAAIYDRNTSTARIIQIFHTCAKRNVTTIMLDDILMFETPKDIKYLFGSSNFQAGVLLSIECSKASDECLLLLLFSKWSPSFQVS